jgi:hypothetical protein
MAFASGRVRPKSIPPQPFGQMELFDIHELSFFSNITGFGRFVA